MIALKIYLTVTWLIGILMGIFLKRNWYKWDELKDSDFSIDLLVCLIIVLSPFILPYCLIRRVVRRTANDN